MPSASIRAVCRWALGPVLLALSLRIAVAAEDTPLPDLQDMQIAGRVLRFQDAEPSGGITVAVVYAQQDARSHDEAVAVAALLGTGLAVGGLTLRPVLVEQAQLAAAGGYGAVFAAAGVDDALLSAALRQRRVPCLTRHLDLVEHGACTVAIRSAPSVSIVLSTANAAAAGVRFATAFRMMVREI